MTSDSRGEFDRDALTRSDILPWTSRRLFLIKSRTFWSAAALAVLIVLLFTNRNQAFVLSASMGLILFLFVFGMRSFLRSNISWFLIGYGFAVEYLLMLSPVWSSWAFFWRQSIPSASWASDSSPFALRFLSSFFGEGLAEDSFKLLPAAMLLIAALVLTRSRMATATPRLAAFIVRLQVLRPTTIVMIAVASAAAFVYVETLYLYVPNAQLKAAQWVIDILEGLPLSVSGFPFQASGKEISTADWSGLSRWIALNYGFAEGVKLLIPRTLGWLTGHGAYAGTAAYFVALAVHKPRFASVLVPLGFVFSATLHALWNQLNPDPVSFADAPVRLAPAAILACIFLLGAAIKAIELDWQLGFNDAGRPLGESVVLPTVRDFPAVTPTPAVQAADDRPTHGILVIEGNPEVGGRRIVLQADSVVTLPPLPAAGLPPDVAFVVVGKPGEPDVFGLRNVGARAWRAVMPDESESQVEPGRSVQIIHAASIDFGSCRGRIELNDQS